MHLERLSGPARNGGLALALAAALAQPRGAAGQDAPARSAAGAGTALGVDLYRIFAAGDGNVFFSPYSVSEALALLSSGADGKTRQELLKSLHWTQGPGQMPAAFGDAGPAAGGRVPGWHGPLGGQQPLVPAGT